MDDELARFARTIPKAELHVHIEGTLEPELMFECARRNGVTIPYASVDEVRAAYSFTDLQSFLDVYYAGASVLRTEDDFCDLMAAYLDRAVADGVRRAEVFFDPQTHTERGIGYEVFMRGFARAIDVATAEHGISVGLILCFLRHLSGEAAVDTLREAEPYLDQIIGVGLDSSEVDNPPSRFVEAFDHARAAGLRLVAHAGEEGPPAYIIEALDVLGVDRIDHGVRCEEDDALVARLVESGTALTVCPLSNVALRVVDDLADHNLGRLMGRGVAVTINSDDPAYFGGYIGDNFVETVGALGLSRADVVALARRSFDAAFVDDTDRITWLAELDTFVAAD